MRRLGLSILSAAGFALLTACGAGSGFAGSSSSESITSIAFTNGSGQADDFFVSPTGTTPLEVNAIGVDGSGPNPQYAPDATFTWGARYIDPTVDPANIASYLTGSTSGSSPTGSKPCPAIPATLPTIPILIPGGTGTKSSIYPGYTLLPSTQASKSVYIGAIPGISTSKSFCIRLEAAPVSGGSGGGVTVLISNSP